MDNDGVKEVPLPTLRRLPSYYHYLKKLQDAGREVVSCTHIAEDLNLDPTQVRKDLSTTGVRGKPKTGYPVTPLITAIEEFLNWNNLNEAFLVGSGNLGNALLAYEGFKQYGLNIVAAFDNDENKIGREVHGKKILSLEHLPDLVKRMNVLIGIITVPADFARTVADLMVESGIKAIWNFTPVNLTVPGEIIVQNENLATGLAILMKKLSEKYKKNINP